MGKLSDEQKAAEEWATRAVRLYDWFGVGPGDLADKETPSHFVSEVIEAAFLAGVRWERGGK